MNQPSTEKINNAFQDASPHLMKALHQAEIEVNVTNILKSQGLEKALAAGITVRIIWLNLGLYTAKDLVVYLAKEASVPQQKIKPFVSELKKEILLPIQEINSRQIELEDIEKEEIPEPEEKPDVLVPPKKKPVTLSAPKAPTPPKKPRG